MDGNEVLSVVLVKMATSPVKADRDAIARIERECQADVNQITTSLENSRILAEAFNSCRENKPSKILATGLFFAAVIGIVTMFLRPSYIWYGVSLGFLAGFTVKSVID